MWLIRIRMNKTIILSYERRKIMMMLWIAFMSFLVIAVLSMFIAIKEGNGYLGIIGVFFFYLSFMVGSSI